MITIAGAGLAGLTCAVELARRGASVRIFETSHGIGKASAAWFAGGMLAPWCERESAEEDVVTLGAGAADWWANITPVARNGTLVVAAPRDRTELNRFARRTSAFRPVDGAQISALEPGLSGRFAQGLFFEQEAHLNPRVAISDLAKTAQDLGVEIILGQRANGPVDLDCTGMCAALPNLRAVRGEIAILHCPEVTITRTLRLLHPRIPLYLVPRPKGHFMIGATMIESASDRPISLRSLSELLGAAFAIHPGFAEASVVETGSGLRPALPDNLPRLVTHNGTLHLNGLYRHGFLLAPAMAARVAQHFIPETPNANHRECQAT